MPVARAYIDGAEVTSATLAGSVTHQHNRPSFATIRRPSFLASGGETSRLKVTLGGSLDFHGSCVLIEDEGGLGGPGGGMYTTMTFASPATIFEFRPARDADGDFSKPSFIEDFVYAPKIVEEILTNSMVSGDPSIGEGPMGIQLGSFSGGGVNVSGAPADWPMSCGAVIALLVQTGQLDVVETPIDSGGNMAMVSGYNGDYGADRTGSVRFEYKTGASNVSRCRRTQDLREIMNKLWIYLGPRVGTKADPAGDQHWDANITGTSSFAGHPFVASTLGAMMASRSAHYERMQIRIMDGDGAAAVLELYKSWWLMETWLRSRPSQFVYMTPEPGIAPSFRTGDKIHVAAGSAFRGGFAGTQRVMEYTYGWDHTGVVQLSAPVGEPRAPAVVATYDADGR